MKNRISKAKKQGNSKQTTLIPEYKQVKREYKEAKSSVDRATAWKVVINKK